MEAMTQHYRVVGDPAKSIIMKWFRAAQANNKDRAAYRKEIRAEGLMVYAGGFTGGAVVGARFKPGKAPEGWIPDSKCPGAHKPNKATKAGKEAAKRLEQLRQPRTAEMHEELGYGGWKLFDGRMYELGLWWDSREEDFYLIAPLFPKGGQEDFGTGSLQYTLVGGLEAITAEEFRRVTDANGSRPVRCRAQKSGGRRV